MIGTVKFFSIEKGYGFIVPDDKSPDVFVHIKDLQKSGMEALKEGQRVEFDLMPSRNGKTSAQNVRHA